MLTKEELENSLRDIASQFWNENEKPLLLSNLAPILSSKSIDYKSFLENKSLKAFIDETGPEAGYKLVIHPFQKAKIGILPNNSEFEYQADSTEEASASHESQGENSSVVIDFLKKLSKLPSEDLEKISIPVSVLVKLIK